jgi:hypothetical protein
MQRQCSGLKSSALKSGNATRDVPARAGISLPGTRQIHWLQGFPSIYTLAMVARLRSYRRLFFFFCTRSSRQPRRTRRCKTEPELTRRQQHNNSHQQTAQPAEFLPAHQAGRCAACAHQRHRHHPPRYPERIGPHITKECSACLTSARAQ